MKKITSVIVLLLIAVSSVFSDNQKIITVMDFETSGVSEQEMTLIVDFLSSSVSDYEDYILIDRRQREIILSEAQFSNSGCADESCAIEIGQLLSASEMIVGSLGSVGSRYLMNIKLIDVETGKTIKDVSEKYGSIDELVDGSEFIISTLFNKTAKIEIKAVQTEDVQNTVTSVNSTPVIETFSFGSYPDKVTLNKEMYDTAKRNRGLKITSGILYGIGGVFTVLDIIGLVGSGGLPTDNDGWTIFFSFTGGSIVGLLGGIITGSLTEPVYDIDGLKTKY